MKKATSEINSVGRIATRGDPHQKIKTLLVEFLLSLIQAFLRTGYYTPDHPESKKAKVGLYEDFQKLFVERNELTFLARDELEGRTVLIEGVLPEIQDLNSLMIAGMAEMYVPRFVKFLENKDLLSLTLKGTMTRMEFANFVDLMGEPTFVDTQRKEDKERFSKTLHERGIFNISYIYNEELLARGRTIHWRSQIALTRLKKDFSMVPFYMDLDPKGLKKVRSEIIQDVFRPFHNAEAIYSVLMNSDLAETEEFKEAEIDKEVIACLSDDLLLKVSQTLLEETIRYEKTKPTQGKSATLARQFATALNQRQINGREAVLDDYAKLKLIPLEQLPRAKQLKIIQKQLTDKFTNNSKSFLNQLEKIQDGEKYNKIARFLKMIVPELIRRDGYEKVLQIIIHLHRQINNNEHCSTYAQQILGEIGSDETLDMLRGKFLTGDQEQCSALAPIFLKLDLKSMPHLLSMLKESNDFSIRKNVCEIFAQMQPAYIDYILKEISKEEMPTGHAIRIMRALGEVGCEEWVQPLNRALEIYLSHETPRIREEALWVYYMINGNRGEAFYFGFLTDADIGVQKKAIQCLGHIKSASALQKFLEMLKEAEDAPSEEQRIITATIYSVLGFYGNVRLPEIGSMEDLLLVTLERSLTRRSLKFIKKKKGILSNEAVASICEALGKVGTEKSRDILQKLKKQNESNWKIKAEEALARIAERGEGQKNSLQAP